MTTEFFLHITPPTATHQQKKVANIGGKPRFYEPQNVKNARELYTFALRPFRPPKPYLCPVRLVTKWYFPLVKGRKDGDFKDTRPDCDNIIKLLKDCMTDLGFWRDDAQVVSETTEKFYANSPGIWVRVEAVHKTAQNITVEEKR